MLYFSNNVSQNFLYLSRNVFEDNESQTSGTSNDGFCDKIFATCSGDVIGDIVLDTSCPVPSCVDPCETCDLNSEECLTSPSFFDFNGQQCSGCPELKECTAKSCTEEVQVCNDGSFVARDPTNGCEFKACPSSDITCSSDVYECQDGSFVSRDPENGCTFTPCADVSDETCPIPSCMDPCDTCDLNSEECVTNPGFFDFNGKECPGCPELKECSPKSCSKDVKVCKDGSFVSRDPVNGCEFKPCNDADVFWHC